MFTVNDCALYLSLSLSLNPCIYESIYLYTQHTKTVYFIYVNGEKTIKFS